MNAITCYQSCCCRKNTALLLCICSKRLVNPRRNHVPNIPVTVEDLLLGAGCQVGIGKPLVDGLFCTGYNRADPVGIIAEGDCEIKWHANYFINGFGTVMRDIDPDLAHDLDCVGTHAGLAGTGAEYIKTGTVFRPQKSFCHLGTGSICGTDKKDPWFYVHILSVCMISSCFLDFKLIHHRYRDYPFPAAL